MFLYYVYYAITYILDFFVPTLINVRLRAGKEDKLRCFEKVGRYNTKRPKGRLIWFHVASVGEFNSIALLVREVEKEVAVLITCVTLNASKLIEKANFHNAIGQFAPFDTPQIVDKFLHYWRPDVGVFIDSEVWPNLVSKAAEKARLINLNARLSDTSAKRWGYIKPLARLLYNKFALVLPSSKYDMQKIASFVDDSKLQFIGNLKYSTEEPMVDHKQLVKYRRLVGKKIVIFAASTHEGEEELMVKAYNVNKQKHKDIFLIIAPRNPKRGREVASICQTFGHSTTLRSESSKMDGKKIYIADTIGEMGLWYSLSNIVIMGGTFSPVSGHNIIEPAKFGNAIIVGNYTSNIKDIVSDFVENNALVISNKTKLTGDLDKLLSKLHYRESLEDNALKASNTSQTLEMAKKIILS